MKILFRLLLFSFPQLSEDCLWTHSLVGGVLAVWAPESSPPLP